MAGSGGPGVRGAGAATASGSSPNASMARGPSRAQVHARRGSRRTRRSSAVLIGRRRARQNGRPSGHAKLIRRNSPTDTHKTGPSSVRAYMHTGAPPHPPRQHAPGTLTQRAADVHLLDRLRALLRYRWIAVSVFAVVLIGAGLHTYSETPLYRAGRPHPDRARGRAVAGGRRRGQRGQLRVFAGPGALLPDPIPHPDRPRTGPAGGQQAGSPDAAGVQRVGAAEQGRVVAAGSPARSSPAASCAGCAACPSRCHRLRARSPTSRPRIS